AILGEEPAKADGGGRFAVGEVVDDLARAPLSRPGLCVQLLRRGFQQCLGGRGITIAVLGNEVLSFFVIHSWPPHAEVVRHPRVLAMPGAFCSCSVCGTM